MTLIPTDAASAQTWAEHWVACWNARDLPALLALFAEDAEFRSPKAAVITGNGTVRGKAAMNAYWQAALLQIGTLRFLLEAVHWDGAAKTLILRYVAELGAQRLLAAEIFDFNDEGLVCRGTALYGAPAA